ncbi:MAG: hypothetical protein ACK5R0_00165 [Bacteroidota bacterium]
MKKIEQFKKFVITQDESKKIRGGVFSHAAICNVLSAGVNLSIQNRDVAAIVEFSLARLDAGCI